MPVHTFVIQSYYTIREFAFNDIMPREETRESPFSNGILIAFKVNFFGENVIDIPNE